MSIFRAAGGAVLAAGLLVALAGCGGNVSGSAGGSSSNGSTPSLWAWITGASSVNALGVYGSKGGAASTSVPGARAHAVSWKDAAGNLWLFGGVGYDSSTGANNLNDLWKYSPGTGLWSWVGGSSTANAAGVYGAATVPAAGNVPGARSEASSWIDAAGNLWLFGGIGYDSTGSLGALNDLWMFTPSSGLWSWVSGDSVIQSAGARGALGAASSAFAPSARANASAWYDAAGYLWLFGGYGDDSGVQGDLGDLWRFNPSDRSWAWISGASTKGIAGTYGTLGAESASNVPGSRNGASAWVDPSSGNLWLFGGYGYGSGTSIGYLNDLWLFDRSTGLWSWRAGSSSTGATGVYGSQGSAATGNVPGARVSASSWADTSGNLWLFGGVASGASGSNDAFSDLWKYNTSSKLWTWVQGASTQDAAGAYGTRGSAASGNAPGARFAALAWRDSSGDLWMFGGQGYDGSRANGYLNDLWRFAP